MSTEVSYDPKDWAPIFERIIFQIAYRQLGIVALHCPIKVSAETIDYLCKNKGMGEWKWLLSNRILIWSSVPVNHAMKVHIYIFGGKERQQNTVFVRQGFWRLWLIETAFRTFDKTLPGRILARL